MWIRNYSFRNRPFDFSSKGKVCLLGDWNARVGELDEIIDDEDENVRELLDLVVEEDLRDVQCDLKQNKRVIVDKVVSGHGKFFHQLCKSLGG